MRTSINLMAIVRTLQERRGMENTTKSNYLNSTYFSISAYSSVHNLVFAFSNKTYMYAHVHGT